MRYLTSTQVSHLIEKYISRGGEVMTMCEGILGHGDMLLWGEGLKTAVINEIAVSAWASHHKIRFYNEMPAKYQKIIDQSY